MSSVPGDEPGPKGERIHPGADAMNPSELAPGSLPGRAEADEDFGPGNILRRDAGGVQGAKLEIGTALGQVLPQSLMERMGDQDALGKPGRRHAAGK